MRRIRLGLSVLLLVTVVALVAAAADPAPGRLSYLPLAYRTEPTPTPTPTPTPSPTPPPNYEFRGLWVTRFEWTSHLQPGTPATLAHIVNQAVNANFNAILFQVRGTGDAFYEPGLEPWSARLNSSNQLGLNPGWDPLATMISYAHAAGLQVHAYINVYPTWQGETPPPNYTNPVHPFWTWSAVYTWDDWRVWHRNTGVMLLNPNYLYASPGAPPVADHVVNVASDIAARYSVDGVHLDYIRYPGVDYSCDPFSLDGFGGNCFAPGWADWQRAQVSDLVDRVYQAIPSGDLLSAAVWPVYETVPNCPSTTARNAFYQDSQGWLQAGIIDAIMPMIYPTDYNNDAWSIDCFTTLVYDYQAHSNGRHIVVGIGGGYADFGEIANRIAIARAAGTAGHAIFSYSSLEGKNYWPYFSAPGGPYEEPALPPP